MTHKHLLLPGLLLILFLMAACGGATPATENENVPTRAAAATLPAPSATPTAGATLLPTRTPRLSPSPAPPTPTPLPTETPCAAGPGQVVRAAFNSRYTGGDVAYRIYLPPCYARSQRRYPVLYLLHGNIHDDSFWDGLGADEALTAGIAAGTLPPFLLVMPDGGSIANNTSGGPFSFESVVMEELIPHVERTYCAWGEPAGRAIGGVSRGGYWALEIAFRHADQFASVGGHSAALLDVGATVDLNPQYTGLNNDLGDLRIYFDIGAGDWVRPNIERLHEDMTAAGIPHQWVLNEGGHDDAYWSAQVANYLSWYAVPWPMRGYPSCP